MEVEGERETLRLAVDSNATHKAEVEPVQLVILGTWQPLTILMASAEEVEEEQMTLKILKHLNVIPMPNFLPMSLFPYSY